MKYVLICIVLLLDTDYIFSQNEMKNIPSKPEMAIDATKELVKDAAKRRKKTFYLSWGYNKDYFSRSDIHFKNHGSDEYDFTLYQLKAKDRPGYEHVYGLRVPFKSYIENITVPQYVYRLGMYFNNERDEGIELNFDHTKYVMVENQRVRLKGQIRSVEYDQDTLVGKDFLQFEHTNGGNFLMLNYMRRLNLIRSKAEKYSLGFVVKPGAGIVIPKTDVHLFGEELDNRFHVAGWIAGLESGFRFDFLKHHYLEATAKGAFADYFSTLTVGTGKASHRFRCFEIILSTGWRFEH